MNEELAINDPSVINDYVAQIEEAPAAVIKTAAPSRSEVILPGGYLTKDGSVVKYAEVRELTGLDEEAISKSGSVGRALSVMLQRGLVSVGLENATKEMLDGLLSGDRDAILIGIRRVTFGDTVSFNFPCPHCRADLDVKVDIDKDIPIRTLEDPVNGRTFTYMSEKSGQIVVNLPNGVVQKKLLENTDKTVAELNTIMLAGCVQSVNGIASFGASTVLSLGMADREKIISEILANTPGPRLGEVSTICEACGEEISMPLALSDLFRL